MIEFRLTLEVLGKTSFGFSPLGELAASLRALGHGRARAPFRPWLQEVAAGLRAVDLSLLQAVVPPGYVAPDFMFAWSPDPRTTIEQQLAALEDVPAEVVTRDLRQVWEGRRPPERLGDLLAGGGRTELVTGLAAYWDVAVRPFWPRIRAAIDEDIAYRASRVLAHGLYGVLEDLHPEVSVRDEVLAVDKPQHPDAAFATPTLTLIPSVFAWPQLVVAHSAPDCFELQYATRGVGRVWEGLAAGEDHGSAFSALVGRTRAAILVRLATPHSTTQLARVLGSSPGSVSAHLSVLRRNGLVSSTRAGRSVMYQRTSLATSVLAASEPAAASESA